MSKHIDDKEAILDQLRTLSRVMDTAIKIPGTKIRFGADSLLGLFPIAGDWAGFVVSLYLLYRARQLGVSGVIQLRMLVIMLVDACLGMIPFAGFLFDVLFQANQRSLNLLLEEYPHLDSRTQQLPLEDES